MKKILSIIFATIILTALCSCGKDADKNTEPTTSAPTKTEIIVSQPQPRETQNETMSKKTKETQEPTEEITETQEPKENIKKINKLSELDIKIKGKSVKIPCEVSKIMPKNYELINDFNNLESEGVIVVKTIKDTKSSDETNNIDLHINYDIKNKHEITTEKLLKSQCFGFHVEKTSRDCVTINGFGCGDNVRDLMETIHESYLVEDYTHKSSGKSKDKMFIVRYKFKEGFMSLSGNNDIIEKISVVYDNSKK